MQAANRFAFKEWAVICAALSEGRQTLILRKGGIHERRGEFRVEHPEFWLFPTYVHQEPQALAGDARPLLDRTLSQRPPDGLVRIGHYAVVCGALEMHDPAAAVTLSPHHVWSHETVDQRYHYRRPGLWVLPVRVYRLPRPFELADSPHFAGCRSWVDLPAELPTAGAEPVLSDDEFARRLAEIRAALSVIRLA